MKSSRRPMGGNVPDRRWRVKGYSVGMANFVFGQVLGRVGTYVQNVINNTPANSAIVWVPMSQSGTAEQAETLTTMAAVEADANFAERTGGSWSRITQTDSGAGLTYTFDATNNRFEADSNDLVWAGPTTGATTGLIACYDDDTTAGTDSALIPLVHLDMAVTPDGNQVTFVFNAEGWYNATRV